MAQALKNSCSASTHSECQAEQLSCIYNNTEYGMIYSGALCGIGDFALVPGPHVCEPKGIRDLQEFMMVHHMNIFNMLSSVKTERGNPR